MNAVVSYWNSTSNHNYELRDNGLIMLYLIEILHQTTTMRGSTHLHICCILLKFYIKPQQESEWSLWHDCCILLKFYIKPQQFAGLNDEERVVSYWNSTSNHNVMHECVRWWKLYLIEILHQTTTCCARCDNEKMLYLIEILHQTTTREHVWVEMKVLYLIEILHQTTTTKRKTKMRKKLYLIEILHQTTTV